jgi:hypothetical protein
VTVPVPAELRHAPAKNVAPTSQAVPPVENEKIASGLLPADPMFAPPMPLGVIPTPRKVIAKAEPLDAPLVAKQAPQQFAAVAPRSDFDPLAAAERPIAPPVATKPEAVATPAIVAAPIPAPRAVAPSVARGDFDPLAAADNAPLQAAAASAPAGARFSEYGYIAPSRYYTRRY